MRCPQSNMQYPIGSPTCWNESNINCTVHDAQCGYGCVNQSAAEITAMADYPLMRLSQNTNGGSKTPLAESGNTGWMAPAKMGGKFSATCWFFGRDVFKKLSPPRPLGLIETNVGGTPDQHWSSPEAIDKCKGSEPWDWPANFTDSVLWNGKVVPLLRTTIKGAIWCVCCHAIIWRRARLTLGCWGQVSGGGELARRRPAVQLLFPGHD